MFKEENNLYFLFPSTWQPLRYKCLHEKTSGPGDLLTVLCAVTHCYPGLHCGCHEILIKKILSILWHFITLLLHEYDKEEYERRRAIMAEDEKHLESRMSITKLVFLFYFFRIQTHIVRMVFFQKQKQRCVTTTGGACTSTTSIHRIIRSMHFSSHSLQSHLCSIVILFCVHIHAFSM